MIAAGVGTANPELQTQDCLLWWYLLSIFFNKNKRPVSLLNKEKKLNGCPEFATQDFLIMEIRLQTQTMDPVNKQYLKLFKK